MKPNPPRALWVALIALILISVAQFVFGIALGKPSLAFITVPLNLVLVYGLWHGFRWAFIVTLVCCVMNLGVALGGRVSAGHVLLIEGLFIVLPLYLARDYFLKRPPADPLRCPHCGYCLLGLTVPRCPECGAEFNIPG